MNKHTKTIMLFKRCNKFNYFFYKVVNTNNCVTNGVVYFIICHKTFVLECLNVISHYSKASLESMGVPADSALLSAGTWASSLEVEFRSKGGVS